MDWVVAVSGTLLGSLLTFVATEWRARAERARQAEERQREQLAAPGEVDDRAVAEIGDRCRKAHTALRDAARHALQH